MRTYLFITFLLALCLAVPAFATECTFDQEGTASELQKIARRNPGYKNIPDTSGVEWVKHGYTIRLTFGGCADLGASVRVSRNESTKPLGVKQLIRAVSRYWSPSQARAARAVLVSRKFTRQIIDDSTSYLELSGPVSDEFPFGFTIELRENEAVLYWTMA